MPIRLENVGIAVRDLDGNHADIAMLQTPDGNGRLELVEYLHPDLIETEPRHGCHPLRGVAT